MHVAQVEVLDVAGGGGPLVDTRFVAGEDEVELPDAVVQLVGVLAEARAGGVGGAGGGGVGAAALGVQPQQVGVVVREDGVSEAAHPHSPHVHRPLRGLPQDHIPLEATR